MLETYRRRMRGSGQLLPKTRRLRPWMTRCVFVNWRKELEDIVAELPRRPLMAGREGLRLSLAGSQSKLRS
jgi:hypothetical protein